MNSSKTYEESVKEIEEYDHHEERKLEEILQSSSSSSSDGSNSDNDDDDEDLDLGNNNIDLKTKEKEIRDGNDSSLMDEDLIFFDEYISDLPKESVKLDLRVVRIGEGSENRKKLFFERGFLNNVRLGYVRVKESDGEEEDEKCEEVLKILGVTARESFVIDGREPMKMNIRSKRPHACIQYYSQNRQMKDKFYGIYASAVAKSRFSNSPIFSHNERSYGPKRGMYIEHRYPSFEYRVDYHGVLKNGRGSRRVISYYFEHECVFVEFLSSEMKKEYFPEVKEQVFVTGFRNGEIFFFRIMTSKRYYPEKKVNKRSEALAEYDVDQILNGCSRKKKNDFFMYRVREERNRSNIILLCGIHFGFQKQEYVDRYDILDISLGKLFLAVCIEETRCCYVLERRKSSENELKFSRYAKFECCADDFRTCSISPCGKYLALGGSDCEIVVVDLMKKLPFLRMSDHQNRVYKIRFDDFLIERSESLILRSCGEHHKFCTYDLTEEVKNCLNGSKKEVELEEKEGELDEEDNIDVDGFEKISYIPELLSRFVGEYLLFDEPIRDFVVLGDCVILIDDSYYVYVWKKDNSKGRRINGLKVTPRLISLGDIRKKKEFLERQKRRELQKKKRRKDAKKEMEKKLPKKNTSRKITKGGDERKAITLDLGGIWENVKKLGKGLKAGVCLD